MDISAPKTADIDNSYDKRYKKVGLTLLNDLEDRVAVWKHRPHDAGGLGWTFRACRGKGACMLPERSDQVLGCVRRDNLLPQEVKEASDYLRWLINLGYWPSVDGLGSHRIWEDALETLSAFWWPVGMPGPRKP